MYSSRQSDVLEREKTINTSDYGVYDSAETLTKSEYVTPSLKFIRVGNVENAAPVKERPAVKEDINENITPSKTTMQFINMEKEDVYEEVKKTPKEDENKQYRINTKGKVLIAVYALAILTIFSLIILNARMLRHLDASIQTTTDRVQALNEETLALGDTLDYVKSDEVIISKAEGMGFNR